MQGSALQSIQQDSLIELTKSLGGQLVGIGTVGYNFVSIDLDSVGNLLYLTRLDHGEIERYYTISDYAKDNSMREEEVYYFINKFFEFKIIK